MLITHILGMKFKTGPPRVSVFCSFHPPSLTYRSALKVARSGVKVARSGVKVAPNWIAVAHNWIAVARTGLQWLTTARNSSKWLAVVNDDFYLMLITHILGMKFKTGPPRVSVFCSFHPPRLAYRSALKVARSGVKVARSGVKVAPNWMARRVAKWLALGCSTGLQWLTTARNSSKWLAVVNDDFYLMLITHILGMKFKTGPPRVSVYRSALKVAAVGCGSPVLPPSQTRLHTAC